jgi:CheY-like chemotaxis protein
MDASLVTRVLVVDDNDLMRLLIATMLTRGGYDVVAVGDGPAAIAAAQGNVDVVLLDLTLPGIDGLEVCRQLRAAPATTRLPIIMLTGRDDPRDVRDGLRAGADDFLIKPFEEPDLISAVKRLASRGSLAPGRASPTGP